MHDRYIADIYRPETILFAANSKDLSSFSSIVYAASSGKAMLRNVLRYGRSRSFKVMEIGTNRKPIATSY